MNVANCKILIVEDNLKLNREMTEHFRASGNCVFSAENLTEAVEIYKRENTLDAVILDVLLPDGTGLDLFKIPKATVPPVVILSDLDGDDEILNGLDAGAADYVTKPCSMRVLERRLALRLLPKKDARVEKGYFVADSALRTVTYRGQPLQLTSSEFNIFYFLITHSGTFFTAGEIYEKVWDAPSLQTTTVNRHLSTLRRKLKDASEGDSPILTEFGKGYCFYNTKKE